MARTRLAATDNLPTLRTTVNASFNELYDIGDLPTGGATYTTTAVNGGGGSNTDLVTAAVAAATGTVDARTTLLPYNGTFIENGSNVTGLRLKDYVDIIGDGPFKTIFKNVAQSSGNEVNVDVVNRLAKCKLANATLIAYRCKYAIHADGSGQDGFIGENLILHHRGGQDGYSYDIGYGGHPGETVKFKNVTCLGKGIYAHGATTDRVAGKNWTLILENVTCNELYIDDMTEYVQNKIILKNCNIKLIRYAIRDTYYLASPGDVLYNRGFMRQSITIDLQGANKIGAFEYVNSDTLTRMGSRILPLAGFSVIGVNKNASTISKGYAVKLLTDPGIANADNANLYGNNVDLYNASGIFYGVMMEDTATNGNGAVQITGNPEAYCLGASSSIAYGDALELNSSGQFIKRTSGEIVAYALAATSSNTTIRVRLK
jgi:hypothetical protein